MRPRKPAVSPESSLEEILIGIGALLIVAGLWSHLGALALVVPGSVLLWIGLPSRAPFIAKPGSSETSTTRRVSE